MNRRTIKVRKVKEVVFKLLEDYFWVIGLSLFTTSLVLKYKEPDKLFWSGLIVLFMAVFFRAKQFKKLR